jgi:Holliday junction resolvasome RuvABC DNA-binding subunit
MIYSVTGYLTDDTFHELNTGVITIPLGKGCYIAYRFKLTPSFIKTDELVTVYFYTVVGDKKSVVYGFTDFALHDMFERLLSVDGIGVSLAFVVMNSLDYGLFTQVLKNKDKNKLMQIKGIGEKVANKILKKLAY